MIKTIADTIVWCAKERIKEGVPYQDINSAIHAVSMDVEQLLMDFMSKHKGKEYVSC